MISKQLIQSLDKDNFIQTNYFQRTTSPSQVMFDHSGNGIQRSYIGGQNYLSNIQIERCMTPTDLAKEVKRLGNTRKIEMENTQLKGRHAPSSIINNPRLVKVNNSNAGSFLMADTPLNRKIKRNTRIMTGKTEGIPDFKPVQDNIRVEEKANLGLTNNIMRRRKRQCG